MPRAPGLPSCTGGYTTRMARVRSGCYEAAAWHSRWGEFLFHERPPNHRCLGLEEGNHFMGYLWPVLWELFHLRLRGQPFCTSTRNYCQNMKCSDLPTQSYSEPCSLKISLTRARHSGKTVPPKAKSALAADTGPFYVEESGCTEEAAFPELV